LVVFVLVRPYGAAMAQATLDARIYFQGFGEIRQGPVEIILLKTQPAARLIGRAALVIHGDGGVEVGLGLVVLIAVQIDVAAVDVGRHEFWVRFDSAVEIRQRFFGFASGDEGGAAIVEAAGAIGIALERGVVIGNCLVSFLFLGVRYAAEMISQATVRLES